MNQIEEVDSLRKGILDIIEKHFHACNHVRFLKAFKLSVDKNTNAIKGFEMTWHYPKSRSIKTK